VKNLAVTYTFSTGTLKGQESAVLAVNGILYFVTSFPNYLVAIDLSKPGGELKWKFDPKPDPAAQGVACCQPVNRGAFYADGTLYYNTVDTHTYAIDAESGAVKWKTRVGDFTGGEAMTMAPLVVKDKVLVGNSGSEYGARGWLVALNTRDGSEAWRAFSTGPDSEVLIDPAEFKPFYPQYRGKDLGVREWPPDHWKIGGGTVWGWISYDPELDLIFYGTSNPSPWNHLKRPGENFWTEGIFARQPDTGKARWFYQWSPHGLWDHSGVNENVMLDVTGRASRARWWSTRTATATCTCSIAPAAKCSRRILRAHHLDHGRRPQDRPPADQTEMIPQEGKVTRNVCPNSPGAKDWPPSAFSKQTGLLYVPHNNSVHGLGAHGCFVHSRHGIHRRESALLPGPGRQRR
jgi:PQQ-dependent dehydrogenase (methanol/ethanol family)